MASLPVSLTLRAEGRRYRYVQIRAECLSCRSPPCHPGCSQNINHVYPTEAPGSEEIDGGPEWGKVAELGSAGVLTIIHMNRCPVGFAEHSRNGIN